MALANSYQEALPTIKGWNSNRDLDQLASDFAARTEGESAEMGTGAYWQKAAGIKGVNSAKDFDQIYAQMKAYQAPAATAPAAAAAPVANPARDADVAQARTRAETANKELNEKRPIFTPGDPNTPGSDIASTAAFGNSINGPNGFTAKFMEGQKLENTASILENNYVTDKRTKEYVDSNPQLATGINTDEVLRKWTEQLERFA